MDKRDTKGNKIYWNALFSGKPSDEFVPALEFGKALAKMYPDAKVKYSGMSEDGDCFLFRIFIGYETKLKCVNLYGYDEMYPHAIEVYENITISAELLCTS